MVNYSARVDYCFSWTWLTHNSLGFIFHLELLLKAEDGCRVTGICSCILCWEHFVWWVSVLEPEFLQVLTSETFLSHWLPGIGVKLISWYHFYLPEIEICIQLIFPGFCCQPKCMSILYMILRYLFYNIYYYLTSARLFWFIANPFHSKTKQNV